MKRSTVTGDKEVINNLKKKSSDDSRKVAGAIQTGVFLIAGEADKQVPVDTGNLKNSQSTRVFRKFKEFIGEIKYIALYAIFVHENKRAGKTRGISPKGQLYKSWAERGKWKYLEDPFKMYRKKIIEMIKNAVKGK